MAEKGSLTVNKIKANRQRINRELPILHQAHDLFYCYIQAALLYIYAAFSVVLVI